MPTYYYTLTNIKKSLFIRQTNIIALFCSACEVFFIFFIVELYAHLKKQADTPSKKKGRPWRKVNF